jgi:hypothetical protein
MKKFQLVIKGSIASVREALVQRGLPSYLITDVGDTTVQISLSAEPYSVMDWFAEPSECKPGVGHPDGTLLWFAEIRE